MVVWNIAIYSVVLVYALCQPVILPFLVMWTLFASSFIHPSLHLFDFCKKSFFINSTYIAEQFGVSTYMYNFDTVNFNLSGKCHFCMRESMEMSNSYASMWYCRPFPGTKMHDILWTVFNASTCNSSIIIMLIFTHILLYYCTIAYSGSFEVAQPGHENTWTMHTGTGCLVWHVRADTKGIQPMYIAPDGITGFSSETSFNPLRTRQAYKNSLNHHYSKTFAWSLLKISPLSPCSICEWMLILYIIFTLNTTWW